MTNTTVRLPIEETLIESWKRVKGTKASYWAAYGIIALIYIAFSIADNVFIAPFIAPDIQTETNHIQVHLNHFPAILNGILGIIVTLVNSLLRIGVLLIGIERAKDQPISYKLMFQSLRFCTALRLLGYVIIQLFIIIGLFLPAVFLSASKSLLFANLNLPNFNAITTVLIYVITLSLGIFLSFRLSLSCAFILEKKVGLFSALKLSFRATRSNVLRLWFLYFILMLIIIISVIPFGIGLIWTLPLHAIIYGTVYKKLTANEQVGI